MSLLPLYPGAKSCVRSGFCCKQAPCSFGKLNDYGNQCEHLGFDNQGRYECQIIDYIITQPGWQMSPAFGAGCCSSLNPDRARIKSASQNS